MSMLASWVRPEEEWMSRKTQERKEKRLALGFSPCSCSSVLRSVWHWGFGERKEDAHETGGGGGCNGAVKVQEEEE